MPLSLKGARGDEKVFRPLEVPASYRSGWPEDVVPGNVARIYARMNRDLRDGTRTAPSFEDAVAVHRVIAAIERAAESGSRTVLEDRFHETNRIERMSLNPQTSSSYVHCQASGATTAHPLQKRARSYCAMIVQREERA